MRKAKVKFSTEAVEGKIRGTSVIFQNIIFKNKQVALRQQL